MKDQTEMIICTYAGDIISSKTRQDFGITYDHEVMRLIDAFCSYDLEINSVVVTRWPICLSTSWKEEAFTPEAQLY